MLFGAHVSSSGGISNAIDRAAELGCDAVQVFTQSPRMWRPTVHAPEQIERFRARRAEVGIGAVVCHALYLVNLASPDREIHRKSVAALEATLDAASAIGADGVIFHVGSHLGAGMATGRRRVVPALRRLLDRTSEELWLLMENSAGAGGTIGRSTDELADLLDAVDRHPRLGLCLDSCHWWVSGIDVTDPAALDEALAHLDDRVGLDRVRCLHVNDAAAGLGSNRDRHASIGLGELGTGLGTFLAHPSFQALPAILETPGPDGHGPDAEEVRRLRALHRAARRRRGRQGRGRPSSGKSTSSRE